MMESEGFVLLNMLLKLQVLSGMSELKDAHVDDN